MSDEEAVDLFMDAIESLDRDVRRYRVYARDLMPGDRIVAEWVYPKGDIPSHEARLGGERLERAVTVQCITTDVDGGIVTSLVGEREAVTYPNWRMFSVDREV